MDNLILIRGLPGSGKSTLAKCFTEYKHFEADMYFGPNYDFDISKVRDAHLWCIQMTSDYIRNLTCYDGVVVSNTFTTKEELEPYFKIACESGCNLNVILCQGRYGSIHEIPESRLQNYADRFEYNIDELYERYVI